MRVDGAWHCGTIILLCTDSGSPQCPTLCSPPPNLLSRSSSVSTIMARNIGARAIFSLCLAIARGGGSRMRSSGPRRRASSRGTKRDIILPAPANRSWAGTARSESSPTTTSPASPAMDPSRRVANSFAAHAPLNSRCRARSYIALATSPSGWRRRTG